MTDKIHVVAMNSSYAKIDAPAGVIHELYDYFSFFTEGYKFNPKFKYGSWDGKIRLMGLDGTIPLGLVTQLDKFCGSMMYDLEIDNDVLPENNITKEEFNQWLDSKEVYSGSTKIDPYWYQKDSVYEAIKYKRRILNLPTSAGKSLIQSLFAKWYLEHHNDKILIIVPTTALVTQMRDDFVDYRLFENIDIHGIMGGTAKDSDTARIYVSTWQSASKQPASWFEQFGALEVDECHLANGTSISNIIKKMTHTQYKLGLSGSLRDGKANVLQYVSLFGGIFRPVTTKDLMNDGQVTNLSIKSILLGYDADTAKACKGLSYQEEIAWLTTNKKRNRFITKLASSLSKDDKNTLVMFKNIKHGKELYEMLKDAHGVDRVSYVSGATKEADRTAIKKATEFDSGTIIVASYGVFSTGISIKKLHNVIFAHPIKSKVMVVQTIGRVLRKHESKDKANLFDIVDNLAIENKRKNAKKKYSHINYAYKHGLSRIERYIKEQFDYAIKKVNL